MTYRRRYGIRTASSSYRPHGKNGRLIALFSPHLAHSQHRRDRIYRENEVAKLNAHQAEQQGRRDRLPFAPDLGEETIAIVLIHGPDKPLRYPVDSGAIKKIMGKCYIRTRCLHCGSFDGRQHLTTETST